MAADSGGIPGDGGVPSGGLFLLGVVFLVFAVCVWFLRPWLHGLIYGVYTTPVLWIGLPVCVGVVAFIYGLTDNPTAIQAVVVVCIVVVMGLTSASGVFASNTLGHATMQDSQPVEQLRRMNTSQPRILPKGVSDRYASNTLNFPQYQVSGSDITMYNGTPYWSYALAPDGLWNHLTKKQHGTVLIDMTRQNAAVKTITGDLNKGIGTAFYNNFKWHLLKNGEYLVNYEDPFMVIHDGEQYIAVPYTVPKFHWLPVPHTTPTWGGVMLIDATGAVTDLSPAKARKHPALEGQKLYPFGLTRRRVAATKYRNGILNTLTSHKEEIEIAPVPGGGNDQPFLLPTDRGPTFVVAAEPYGNAQALNEIWMVDARTGQYYRYSPNTSLFGPRKATDFVRRAARKTDWNRFTPTEPLPIVINGQLFWEVRIVPEDNSGIAYIAFVNAQSSEVQEVETTTAVTNFLQNPDVPDDHTDWDQKNDSPTATIIVERVAPNGTVIETMTIYDNESVRIVQQNNTDASNRTANAPPAALPE